MPWWLITGLGGAAMSVAYSLGLDGPLGRFVGFLFREGLRAAF